MNITKKEKFIVVLKKFNIYFQFISAKKQFLILDAYQKLRMSRIKGSGNELEKSFNKL